MNWPHYKRQHPLSIQFQIPLLSTDVILHGTSLVSSREAVIFNHPGVAGRIIKVFKMDGGLADAIERLESESDAYAIAHANPRLSPYFSSVIGVGVTAIFNQAGKDISSHFYLTECLSLEFFAPKHPLDGKYHNFTKGWEQRHPGCEESIEAINDIASELWMDIFDGDFFFNLDGSVRKIIDPTMKARL